MPSERSRRPPSVLNAVNRAARALGLGVQDAAALALARRYAELIDAGDDEALVEVGPKLLPVLESLKMTPRARAAVLAGKGATGDGDPRRAALTVLRQRDGKD